MSIRGRRLRIAKHCALLVVTPLYASATYADDFSILYHERPGKWSVAADTASKSSEVQSLKPNDDSILSFTAFGRSFNVRLERNDRLLHRLPPNVVPSLRGVTVFKGELVDVPGSWARLTRHGAEITGVIWDGVDLFAIDSPLTLAPYLRGGDSAPLAGPIIYRWRDTAGTLTDELDALGGARFDGSLSASAAADLAAPIGPGRQLDLGLVADTELSAREGPNITANMLSRANIVEGVFLPQLGLHVNVAELTAFTQEDDPFASLVPSTLLDELETHRAATPAQRVQDLTHLLTGKDLESATVGVANLGKVCDERLGTALTQASFGIVADALIMAHEIAHNLGAPHDGEPGPCEGESPTAYIMARNVNDSMQFSACSIQQMQPKLESSCLDLIAPGDVELRTLSVPTDALIDREFEATVVIDNPSAVDAYLAEVTASGSNLIVRQLTSPAADGFVCLPGLSPPACRRNALPAGKSATIVVTARTTAIASATLQVTASSLNDSNTANNVVSHVITAQPMIDLLVEFAPAPDVLMRGQPIEYTATVRNLGNTTATNAIARVENFMGALNIVALSSAAGACAPDLFERYFCQLGDLAPGASQALSLRFRAIDTFPAHITNGIMQGSVSIEATADREVYDRVRSTESVYVTVTDAVADVGIAATPLQFDLGSQAHITFTISNYGPDSASEVRFRHNMIGAPQGLVNVAMTFNVGQCMLSDQIKLIFECRVATLPAGQSLVVTLLGTASVAGPFRTQGYLDARAYDRVLSNNNWDTWYTVSAPPPPSTPPPSAAPPSNPPPAPSSGTTASSGGGGGGGAFDSCGLALLLLTLVARKRRASGPTRTSSSSGARPASTSTKKQWRFERYLGIE